MLIPCPRVDVKLLPLYQQLYIYVIPIITNLGFINIVVVVVRLYWFNKKLGLAGTSTSCSKLGRNIRC
jgi:hypothetical protein